VGVAVVLAIGAFLLALGSGSGGTVAVDGGVPFDVRRQLWARVPAQEGSQTPAGSSSSRSSVRSNDPASSGCRAIPGSATS
jgi:hypothetical protein